MSLIVSMKNAILSGIKVYPSRTESSSVNTDNAISCDYRTQNLDHTIEFVT